MTRGLILPRMNNLDQLPEDVFASRPSIARMYDYWLGGFHNFEVDRKAAEHATSVWPDMPLVLRANRAFLRRAVRLLSSQGIDQFLDIGSGIPTVGNVHEVAQEANPEARVVYVDLDPVAVAHSRTILRDNPRAAVIHADARQSEQILHHPELLRLLDLSRPVGILVVSVLHFLTDDADAYQAIRALREAAARGSYLAITHGSGDSLPPEARDQLEQITRATPTPMKYRPRADIARFFEGFELVDPGLVYVSLWRPENPDDLLVSQPERCLGYAGLGRKP